MPEKYKDEIEEILRKAGEVAPSKPSKESERHPEDRPQESIREPGQSRRTLPAPAPRPAANRPSITPGKIMAMGVVLLVIGVWFWPLIWIGLAMLVGGYALYFVSPRSVNYEKRWRGRSVDEPVSASPLDRIKRWLKN